MAEKTNRSAVIHAAVGASMWGVGGVLSNIVFNTSKATPAWLVSTRLTGAGVAMLLFALLTKRPVWHVWQHRASAIRLILFGIFGVACAQWTYLLAIYTGNAAIATIMLALSPAIITMTVCFREKTAPRRLDVVAILIALVGVFLLVTNGHVNQLHVPLIAVFWGFLGAATGSAYTMLPRPLMQANEPPLVIVGWGLIIGAVLMNFVSPVWRVPAGLTPATGLAILFIVFGATFLAYIWYVSSLKYLRPATASMLGDLEPITATILSVIFLALGFHAFQFVGILLVLGGMFLMTWVPKRKVQ